MRKIPYKKFVILMGLAMLVLIVDGSLSYDILGTGPETFKFWLWVLFILLAGIFIILADESKPIPRDKNESDDSTTGLDP